MKTQTVANLFNTVKMRRLAVVLSVPALLSLLTGCVTNSEERVPLAALGKATYQEALHVETEPSGAKIYFQENYIGVSPMDINVKGGEMSFKRTGLGVFEVSDDGLGDRFANFKSMSYIGPATLVQGGGSLKIQAMKEGYEPATRMIELSSDDDVVRKAFQEAPDLKVGPAVPLTSDQAILALYGRSSDVSQNSPLMLKMSARLVRPPDSMEDPEDAATVIRGHRAILIALVPASSGGQQQQQQQTVVLPGARDSGAAQRGTVLVTSEPPDAEVSADGVFVGNTPANLKLDSGIHIIEVKLDGYKTYHKELRVLADSELSLKAQLGK